MLGLQSGLEEHKLLRELSHTIQLCVMPNLTLKKTANLCKIGLDTDPSNWLPGIVKLAGEFVPPLLVSS